MRHKNLIKTKNCPALLLQAVKLNGSNLSY